MRRHSIIARLGPADKAAITLIDPRAVQTAIQFIDGEKKLSYGLGQMNDALARRGLFPTECAVDLALLAATVTAADTRISRTSESQDTWTREIDLYVPVSDPALFTAQAQLIRRILDFLTGDRWRVYFRPRRKEHSTLIEKKELKVTPFDSVCLFSGGLDSFIGAIDLFDQGRKPLLVSHYWDISTSSQELCVQRIGGAYGDQTQKSCARPDRIR